MGLSPAQIRRARALQKRGLLLREIAALVGADYEQVMLALYGEGVPLVLPRRVETPQDIFAPEPVVRAPSPKPSPKPEPRPEPRPAPAPAMAAPDPAPTGAAEGLPVLPEASAQGAFLVRNARGLWLHESCQSFTPMAKFAWEGSAAQLLAIAQRWPDRLTGCEMVAVRRRA